MEKEENIRHKIQRLCNEWRSDSKSLSKSAEKEIISICEPVIKKFWEIAKEFGLTDTSLNVEFGSSCLEMWDNDYVGTRGSIDRVVSFPDGKVELYYSDGCRGNIYEAYLEMPLAWLDEGAENEYRKFCRAKALDATEKRINVARKKLLELEAHFEELEAI